MTAKAPQPMPKGARPKAPSGPPPLRKSNEYIYVVQAVVVETSV
jgi:hypothetical protein